MLIIYFWPNQEEMVWQVSLFTEGFCLHFIQARGLNKQSSLKMFIQPKISTSSDFPLFLRSTVKVL